MQTEVITNPSTFKHPFTCVIGGPTGSGKTELIKKIIDERENLIDPIITRIIFCYARWQPKYDELKEKLPTIEFNLGLFDLDLVNAKDNNLMILDDLTHLCEKDNSIKNLYTTDSHHKNTSVILITQNIFSNGNCFRTISLNSQYIILMNNPRDRQQISSLARQMFPKNNQFLIEAYNDATQINNFGYLFLDFTQTTDQSNRVQTGIFKNQQRFIYRPNI